MLFDHLVGGGEQRVHVPCAGTGFLPDFGGYPGVALRRLGSSGSCGAGYARGEAPLGLREIDDGTIEIEDVPSTLFTSASTNEAYC